MASTSTASLTDYGLGAALLEEAGVASDRATLHAQPGGWVFMVISNYQLPAGFAPNRVDLLVKLHLDSLMPHQTCSGFIRGASSSTELSQRQRRPNVFWEKTGSAFLAFSSRRMETWSERAPRLLALHLFPFSPYELRSAMKLRAFESKWNYFIDALRLRSDVETAG